MKILVTGSTGRVGRAIYVRLCAEHELIGFDVAPSSTADVVASIHDEDAVAAALRGVDTVIHAAALHAPQVGHRPDEEFEAINVRGTQRLARLALDAGVKRLVFTSTTALYGSGAASGESASWVTEETTPRPKTIYHRTKLAAEAALEKHAGSLAITSLRMSRCFPEPAPLMAAYRLHRGVDARDVAEAHAAALAWDGPGFRKFVISGLTPFTPEDAAELRARAPAVLARRSPTLVAAFAERGWALPQGIDRVYDSSRACAELGWRPRHGFEEVLAELDRGSSEVLPPRRDKR
jgi:nucleoside-diphosphate-sugar epimerase